MTLQIIILNTNSQPDSSFSVSGVFWLQAPANNIVPLPNFKSQVPYADSSNIALLKSGIIVEQTFNTGFFASGTDLPTVQASLQSLYTAAQTTLNNTNSPLSGIIGNVFDGYSWSSTNPFTQTESLFDISNHYTKKFYQWTAFKAMYYYKNGCMQYYDNGEYYTIYFYDQPEAHVCYIWKGTLPPNVINSGYSQTQNDSDLSDFQTNFKSICNKPIAPKTVDGRPTVSPNAFPSWVTLYFTGAGDDRTNGIGAGQPFQVTASQSGQDGYGNTVITWQFNDAAFILGGILVFTGAQLGDYLDYLVFASGTPTGIGTQPVNLSNIGPGNIIVPASPDGYSNTIDITQGVPVPNAGGTGFWDWSEAQTGLGTIVPNYNQQGDYDLFDFNIPLARPALQVPILGDNMRVEIVVESVTSLQILPQWTHMATIHNSGHSTPVQIAWTLAAARAVSVST